MPPLPAIILCGWGWFDTDRLEKAAGVWGIPCICAIGTKLPVEYMAKGMAFWDLNTLAADVAVPAVFIPRPPMMPPSETKTRLASNPGVLVGTPLTSRQEISPIVTEFCDGGAGVGAARGTGLVVLTRTSGGGETVCGSCEA